METSLWELTKGSQVGKHAPDLIRSMLGSTGETAPAR
jgi:hypothetical protein